MVTQPGLRGSRKPPQHSETTLSKHSVTRGPEGPACRVSVSFSLLLRPSNCCRVTSRPVRQKGGSRKPVTRRPASALFRRGYYSGCFSDANAKGVSLIGKYSLNACRLPCAVGGLLWGTERHEVLPGSQRSCQPPWGERTNGDERGDN